MNEELPEELLTSYLDDELEIAQRQSVEKLLAENPDLRLLLEELQAMRQSFAKLPRHTLPASFANDVLAQAEREMLLRPKTATAGNSHGNEPHAKVSNGRDHAGSSGMRAAQATTTDTSVKGYTPAAAAPIQDRPAWSRRLFWPLLAVAAAVAILVSKPWQQTQTDLNAPGLANLNGAGTSAGENSTGENSTGGNTAGGSAAEQNPNSNGGNAGSISNVGTAPQSVANVALPPGKLRVVDCVLSQSLLAQSRFYKWLEGQGFAVLVDLPPGGAAEDPMTNGKSQQFLVVASAEQIHALLGELQNLPTDQLLAYQELPLQDHSNIATFLQPPKSGEGGELVSREQPGAGAALRPQGSHGQRPKPPKIGRGPAFIPLAPGERRPKPQQSAQALILSAADAQAIRSGLLSWEQVAVGDKPAAGSPPAIPADKSGLLLQVHAPAL